MARRYGLTFHPAQLRRLVTGYLAAGSADSVEAYFLYHLDPTGEQAVHNIIKAG